MYTIEQGMANVWADPTAVNPMNFRRARQQKRQ